MVIIDETLPILHVCCRVMLGFVRLFRFKHVGFKHKHRAKEGSSGAYGKNNTDRKTICIASFM